MEPPLPRMYLDDVPAGACAGYVRGSVRSFLEPYALRHGSVAHTTEDRCAMPSKKYMPNLVFLNGGSFHVPYHKLQQFLTVYAIAAERGDPLYCVERSTTLVSRLRFDFDFKWPQIPAVVAAFDQKSGDYDGAAMSNVEEAKKRMGTDVGRLFLSQIMPRLHAIVRCVFPPPKTHDDKSRSAMVLFSTGVKVLKRKGLGYGVHVVWPDVYATPAMMCVIRCRLVQQLEEELGEMDGMIDWKDVVDEAVVSPGGDGTCGAGLRMIWSRKAARCDVCRKAYRTWQYNRAITTAVVLGRRQENTGPPNCDVCHNMRYCEAPGGYYYELEAVVRQDGSTDDVLLARLRADRVLTAQFCSVWPLGQGDNPQPSRYACGSDIPSVPAPKRQRRNRANVSQSAPNGHDQQLRRGGDEHWTDVDQTVYELVVRGLQRLQLPEPPLIRHVRKAPGGGLYVARVSTPYCGNLLPGEVHNSEGVVYFVITRLGIQQRCASESSRLDRRVGRRPCTAYRPAPVQVYMPAELQLLFGVDL